MKKGRFVTGGGWRGEAAAAAMVGYLPEIGVLQNVLTVDDDPGMLGSELSSVDVRHVAWWRRALNGHPATAWVPAGPFDVALVRLPVGRDALDMVLHACASQLKPGGRLFLFGANDEGIRSAQGRVAGLFGSAETVAARGHCRVIAASRPPELPGLVGELRGWRRAFDVVLAGRTSTLVSYPGVFAHGRLDSGTAMLVEALSDTPAVSSALDFGCGAGAIGVAIRQLWPHASLHMLDAFAPAVAAARENVPDATVVLGDGLGALAPRRYDLIASNPPIHTGKGEDFRVLRRLVEEAPEYLSATGRLMIVVQRTVPMQKLLGATFRNVDVVRASNYYRVWRACLS